MIKIRIEDIKDEGPYDLTIKSTLHPSLWNDEQLNPEITDTLLKITEEFVEFLKVEGIEVEDIQLTGSLANFNWSEYSDIDLHLLIDFSKVDENEDLVKQFFASKKNLWNNRHNIEIKGFEVEIYPQDTKEPHHSTGVYSVSDGKWVTKPARRSFSPSIHDIKSKVKGFIEKFDDIDSLEKIDAFKTKIRKMRKCGLETHGEFSVENLTFKVLRRLGLMNKLRKLETDLYDQSFSIKEEEKCPPTNENSKNYANT